MVIITIIITIIFT